MIRCSAIARHQKTVQKCDEINCARWRSFKDQWIFKSFKKVSEKIVKKIAKSCIYKSLECTFACEKKKQSRISSAVIARQFVMFLYKKVHLNVKQKFQTDWCMIKMNIFLLSELVMMKWLSRCLQNCKIIVLSLI